MQIHKIMQKYPIKLFLRDGKQIIVRPVLKDDLSQLIKFFSTIPKAEILIYKDDIPTQETMETWFTKPKYNNVLELVGLQGDEIVAKGTVHEEGLYWKDAAEIKLVIKPELRGKGLGSQMFKILWAECLFNKCQKIVVRLTTDNKDFMNIISRLGFRPEFIVGYSIKDEESGKHKNVMIASYNLKEWKEQLEMENTFFR